MFRRTRALQDPVIVYLDGSPLEAERGEPLAVSLLAAGATTLSRSPKLHRPRSASCLRGGCEGCLMRVQNTPNVMTCQEPARGDERIETQNVVGTRKSDLLRVNDWLFPQGFDHHHFMTDIPALGPIVQSFARKISGLGKLPTEVELARPARRLDVDAVIIGAGLSGLVVAHHLSSKGRRVALVEDGLRLGGSLCALPQHADLIERFAPTNAEVFVQATAVGIYMGEVVVATKEGAVIVRANHKVFATGAHDGVLAFDGNDLPGVMSARAMCMLHSYGVEPDEPFVVIGNGFWAEELERRMGDRVTRIDLASVVTTSGTSHIKSVTVRDDKRKRKIATTVVAVATHGAPAFELAGQAGTNVQFDSERGYCVQADENGRAGDGLWAVGENTGMAFDVEALTQAASRCARAILAH